MGATAQPPFIGADCRSWMHFDTRVRWYAIWIKAYPLSVIHVRHLEPDGSFTGRGFLIEPVRSV